MQPFKDAEDANLMLRRDPDAVVLHPQAAPLASFFGPDPDVRPHAGRHELDGVRQEVRDDLHEGGGVSHHVRERLRNRRLDHGLSLPEFALRLGLDLGHDGPQVEWLEEHLRAAEAAIGQ